ncbi:type VI secretion system baseplate subunit TssK [Methylomonas rapida]|jgi:type VI secretion protein, VC_A0114 family|uniref:Type VI secretion system baseplate subunit TssK n=1 Tax=Methylomonas rapida TaxID=2963939 RepID=A0ABY7GMI0_9GAMM|nr:type VI secretion system baseplate subunit TssK [Methylomonas rapida]WAR45708.1 type VI secretion system baseplate subunit TssK [Methylomonas rapida]
MSENNRVVWSEGMFLRPQHFQQHDRYFENLLRGLSQGVRAYAWGFSRLKLDQTCLAIGKLGLTECSGVFPDGTPFDLPQDDDLPLPLEVPENEKASVVYLALPLRRSDANEVDSESYPDNMARYRLSERQVRDNNSGADGRYDVQIGALKPRLMCDSQERSGYVCLGVARIIEMRADKSVILDENYIPPAVHCASAGILGGFVRELQGLFHTRGEALAARVAGSGQGSGVAEIADFMLLQMINRYQPLLAHLAHAATLHPEELFQWCLQIAGELSTFYRPGKRPLAFPDYRHDDLKASFMPLIDELRGLLSMVLEQNAVQLPLAEVKPGVYVAKRPELNLLEGAIFVLAAKAQVSSELIRSHFPPQVKIGPVEDIQQLVRSALPGINIQALPVAPRQIPYHAGYSYFELNKQSELWSKMAVSGGFAIHIGGSFPELELEFWAIRKG